jgi:ADP-heptose:LPS heptosyltransferase/GT2 family glycosyltransferase
LLFQQYELLANSGWFDAQYYIAANPEIPLHNKNALMHYLETGCRAGLNPSAQFDTAHYLEQCSRLGERPQNALLHYLTVGGKLGLTPNPESQSGETSPAMLCIDMPRIVDGAAVAAVRGGLSIVGWGIAAGGLAAVDIELDGKRIAAARCGLRRPDVAAAHPRAPHALLSGYAAHLPPKALTVGEHRITVSMRGATGQAGSLDFRIEVESAAEIPGPWALRRAMPHAEVDFVLATLSRLKSRPGFRILLPTPEDRADVVKLRRTLESLERQTYSHWDIHLVRRERRRAGTGSRARPLLKALLAEFEHLAPRITFGSAPPSRSASATPRPRKSGTLQRQTLILCPALGDELGCDALLEFALESALQPQADLLYCDERRTRPEDGAMDAFFKPGWSPDLLLATNYLGRAWCATERLIERAALSHAALARSSAFDLTLRLTEAASLIHPIAKVLYQRSESGGDTGPQEQAALKSALRRRDVDADVLPGHAQGHFRVRRKCPEGQVSIVIPTCAADGLVKTCIDSLRTLTRFRNFEILCIQNIPASRKASLRWLKSNVDTLIHAPGDFNWSVFNNTAAARAKGRFLLFLNDDTEIIDPDWLDALLEHASRPEVGIVGPLLLYPDRSVQHAGMMLDGTGRGRHAFRHLAADDGGYFGLARTERNVIAVTGACLLTRRDAFESLGRFDESHAVINNDLDYCLRAWRSGLLTVYTPHARLLHHELSSRKSLQESYDARGFARRWRPVISRGDPYFNPNLSRDHEQFAAEREYVETIHAGPPVLARESVRRILIVKVDHIGDCITAVPAVRRLPRYFPGARISVLTGRASVPIWRSEPCVDETIEFDFFHPRSSLGKIDVSAESRHALETLLRERRFDLAIDLRKQPDSRELLQLSGARCLVGFDTQGRFPWLDVALEWDEDVPLRSKHGHITDDLLALVEMLALQSEPRRGAFITPPAGQLPLPPAERRRLLAKPLICVHCAAGSPMRQWPTEKFSKLIALLLDHGDFNVALIGGPDERQLNEQVLQNLEHAGRVFNLVGRLSLEELPKLLARAALFVGNNSGPHHLAAALGVRTLGIHSGVVDAREWGPLGPGALAIRRNMSCSPCFIEHPKDCPRGLACLIDLPVSAVLKASLTALAVPGPRRPSGGHGALAAVSTC